MKYVLSLLLTLTISLSSFAQLRMNEVCYDPSNTALEGDANNDGVYDQVQDEFIEFVNTSNTALDVSKYKIYDYVIATGVKTLRHTMANGLMVPARGALVVFGGGTAVGTFGGAVVEVDLGTTGLSLANTGEKIILEDSVGTFIDSVNTDLWSNNPNESYTRNPDFTGAYVQHTTARATILFSPGYKVDGNPFDGQVAVKESLISKIVAYPSPTTGKITVVKPQGEVLNLSVLDPSGKAVYHSANFVDELDVSALPVGLYSVKIQTIGHTYTQRILVQR